MSTQNAASGKSSAGGSASLPNLADRAYRRAWCSLARRATKLGRRDGKVPAILGAGIGIAFVGQNIASYLLGLVVD